MTVVHRDAVMNEIDVLTSLKLLLNILRLVLLFLFLFFLLLIIPTLIVSTLFLPTFALTVTTVFFTLAAVCRHCQNCPVSKPPPSSAI